MNRTDSFGIGMTRLYLHILLCIALTSAGNVAHAQNKESGHAKIIFTAKANDSAKTYIGKLRKGDLNNLKYELQRYHSGTSNNIDADDEKGSTSGYVERITVVGENGKRKKKRDETIRNGLIGNYEVKDEKTLKEVKEKKKKAASEKVLTKNDVGNYKKYTAARTQRNTPQLSKYFSISTRRIRNGQTLRKPAGPVALIITYKIREGKNINTYVNVVEEYLKPGSAYNLKYHGSDTKRKYYLEYELNTKN
jgi:hypothetical protein